MENKVATTCKATAIIMFIITVITSIIIGASSRMNYNSGSSITLLVSGFISSLLIFALGELIELLDNIRTNTYELLDLNRREIIDRDKDERQSTSAYASSRTSPIKKTSEGNWICIECEVENKASLIQCKGCGKYR